MEFYRRLSLLLGIILTIWFYFFSYITPLFNVEPVDFSAEMKRKKERSPFTTDKSFMYDLSVNDYINQVTYGSLFEAGGNEWDNFFSDIFSASQTGKYHENRSEYGNSYYFRTDFLPLSDFKKMFTKSKNEIYIKSKADTNKYLRITFENASYNDFGFYSYPKIKIFYPFRDYSFFLFPLGLILYIFLPSKKRKANEVYYQKWRIVLGDVIAFLFVAMFSFVPFMVLGSSQITIFVPLSYLFWLPLLPALYLVFMQAKMASFSIVILDDRFEVATYKGSINYDYKDIESFTDVTVNPPGWLFFLSLFARGRSLPLISSYRTLRINFKNGRNFYLNWIGYFNQKTVAQIDQLFSILKLRNVPKTADESFTKFGYFIGSYEKEIKLLKKHKIIKRNYSGLIAVVFLFLIIAFGSIEIYIHLMPEILPSESAKIESGSFKPEIFLEKSYKEENKAWEGEKILTGKNGTIYLISEERYFEGSGVQYNLILSKIDNSGKTLFNLKFAEEDLPTEHTYATISGKELLITGKCGTDILFIKADTLGNRLAYKRYNVRNLNTNGFFIKSSGSGYQLYGYGETINGMKYIVKMLLDNSGNKKLEDILRIESHSKANIEKIIKVPGGYIAAGTVDIKSLFSNLYITKYDESGRIVFEKSAGGAKPEKFSDIMELPNGDILLAGSTRSFTMTEDYYLVKYDKYGKQLWERFYGGNHDDYNPKIFVDTNGNIKLAGLSLFKNSSYNRSYVVFIEKNGNKSADFYLGENYSQDESKDRISYSVYDIKVISGNTLILTGSKDYYYFSGVEKEMLLMKIKY